MGDLTPRPRGGWQVGGLRRAVSVEVLAGTEATDCYSVAREGDGVFFVQHFPSADTKRPCCRMRVHRQPGESDIDALHRSYLVMEQKHQRSATQARP